MKITYDPKTREVYERGELIGHVVRKARVAAGTSGSKRDRGTLAAGTRKHFWTAVPLQGNPAKRSPWWRPGDGASIGTRFRTCDDAVQALVVHHLRRRYEAQSAWSGAETWRQLRKRRWGF